MGKAKDNIAVLIKTVVGCAIFALGFDLLLIYSKAAPSRISSACHTVRENEMLISAAVLPERH